MTSHATSSNSSRKWVLDDVAMLTWVKKETSSFHQNRQDSADRLSMSELPPPVALRRPPSSFSSRVQTLWSTFKANIRAPATPPSSVAAEDNDTPQEPEPPSELPESGPVERIVVDRSWTAGVDGVAVSSDSSDPDQVTESKSGETPTSHPSHPNSSNDRDSVVLHSGSWIKTRLLCYALRTKHFFYPRRFENGSEEVYLQEDWHHNKTLAICSAGWLVLVWIWAFSVIPTPYQTIDYVFYTGVAMVFNLPLPVFIMYNWPRDHRTLYQIFLVIPVWMTAFYIAINIYLCGFYNEDHLVFSCNGKDFINLFYYTCALQTIGLFGLKMDRLPALIGVLSYFFVSIGLIAPDHDVWGRSAVNFLVFNLFIIWVHYKKEMTDRHVFSARKALSKQYKATQRARANERRTAESKYRLTSYVFHEIRVPLNAALLAVQNMEASGTVAKEVEVEFDALMGSLTMMSKVLNDVLDFHKMDVGHFELVSKPYVFHQSMRSLFIPLQMAADAKGLTLTTDLDPNIDIVARCAAYKAMGEQHETITKHLEEHPNVNGVVIGDEARLRQIVTNLASNACKFTPEGGTVSISTKLVLPAIASGGKPPEDCLSASTLVQHNIDQQKDSTAPDPSIVVRIEVSDTGCGISPRECARGKLFSPFTQTEKGKLQGGKGTGLGLALVRNIVTLSGGRLGVKSELGVGSTFWVELPLGVGRRTLVPSGITGAVPVEFTDSEGSMSSDLAKVLNAAMQNQDSIPEALSHPSLSAVVDAAALKATELSHMQSSPALSVMEQGGPVELVVFRQDDSRPPSTLPSASAHTPLGTSPLPTPATDLSSSTSSRFPLPLISERDASGQTSQTQSSSTVKEDEEASLKQNRSTDLEASFQSSRRDGSRTISRAMRPTHIPLPQAVLKAGATSSSTIISSSSPMQLFDSAFSHINGIPSPRSPASTISLKSLPDIEPGMPVLVVDDDPITRRLMGRTLERMGCQVSVAEDGTVALRMILGSDWDPSVIETDLAPESPSRASSTKSPNRSVPNGSGRLPLDKKNVSFDTARDEVGSGSGSEHVKSLSEGQERPVKPDYESKYALVFLDNQMPVLSGLRTIRILRRLGRRDFIVGLTGNALKPDQEKYLKAGVDKVVTKPIHNTVIKEVLKEADARRKKTLEHSKGSPNGTILVEPS